ncbi:MAG: DUF192 domain-containing protein [Solirubrobacterales bacterium]|nr:DUF192 domain-containing protein [Solirubrobacterales bacterium]
MPSTDYTERFAGLPRRTLAGGVTLLEASTGKARRRGLSRLDSIPADHALHIRTFSVHTFGMRFALDLIWLDRQGTTVRVDRDVTPNRLRACFGARSVVETVAGQADAFLSAGVGTAASDEVEGDRGA